MIKSVVSDFCVHLMVVGGSLGLLSTFSLPAQSAEVIINEIMYHAAPAVPEDTGREWIELYNRGTNAVDLTGWSISKGVSFAFPAIVLPPNGYLVVAADVGAFQSRYPTVTNVVGGWVGHLSNNGEQIQLDNAQGQQVDEVVYASEGDWGIRRRGLSDSGTRGWEWYAEHDGAGRSLELKNPQLSNNHGQNWGASQVENGTPGAVNSLLTADGAPLVLEVRHYPPIPRSSEPVAITARILDEQTTGLSVQLFYRDASSANPPAFSSENLFDDGAHNDGLAGDGVYGVLLPARPNATVIEFYVQATDAGNHSRTWPAPAEVAVDQSGPATQSANAAYQVDDEVYSGTQPIYRLVMTENERLQLQNINRNSNAEMNATLVTADGSGEKIRYNTGVRIRGQGSRGRTPPNHRVNIPNDRRWNGLAAINLNTQFIHAQLAGSQLALRSGVPASAARVVQVRVNGVNLARSGEPIRGSSTGSGFGAYILLEPQNGDWAERHFPLDPNGNVYRGISQRGGWRARLDYRGEDAEAYIQDYGKTSNRSENDWTDLIALSRALSSDLPEEEYLAAIRTNVNVEMWMRYMALGALTVYSENGLPTGVGDDYGMYRGMNDPRFLLVMHDFDTILGEGDGDYNAWGVGASIWLVADRSGGNLPWANRFLRHNEFAPIYFQQLKELADTVFAPEQVNPLLENALGGWVPASTITRMQTYVAQRVANVMTQIPQTYSVTAGLPTQSGYFYTANPTVTVTGTGNALETRSVRVNGLPAEWTAWQGAFSAANVALRPGINQVLVQYFDANNAEVHRSSLAVWYDTGASTALPRFVENDLTLTVAGGPYVADTTVTVELGVTLTIEPGATLYFAPGAGLDVNGTLMAEGTELERIRFTRLPGTNGAWNGVQFTGSPDSSLAFADFEFGDGNGHSLRLVNSTVFLDHLTWSGTTRTIIDMTDSSLEVRNSVFPTIDNDETIHGTGMPADGFVIVAGNFFGGTTGYSDIIDFTGGRRPGPIIQVLNNVFEGGSDDVLDLDGTDAHIEGNVFRHIHKNNTSDSSSNAIATDTNSEITVVRNIFFDCDHGVLLKNGAYLTAQNNTFVGCIFGAINFDETNRTVNPGRGAFVEGNIFWGNGSDFENYYFNHPTEGTVEVIVKDSLLQRTNWPAADTWENVVMGDPLFVDPTNDFRLRGGPAAGTGPNGLDMGALVPGGASIAGEPWSVSASTQATLTVAGPGITHYVYRVNDGPFSNETAVTNPIVLTGLTNGTYTVYVLGKNSAGEWQPTSQPTASRTWTVDAARPGLVLNEVLARNNGSWVVNGESPDWVELFNGGAQTIDLSGMGLTDDPTQPYRFQFPAGTEIAAGEYLVLFADNEAGPGWHLGYALDQTGDAVYLFAASGHGGGLVDSVSFGLQLADRSIGRTGPNTWRLCRPTFAAPNQVQPLGDGGAVKINEWLTEGAGIYPDDFVELYNPNELPVDLGAMYLSDVPATYPTRHQMAPLSFIPGQGALALVADGNAAAGADHLSFRLSPEQGQIALFTPSLTVIDWVLYGPQLAGISQGRQPNGGSAIGYFNLPTPGSGNPGGAGSTTISNVVVPLLPLAQSWRYNQYGTNLGTAWREPSYADANWDEGQALLGQELAGVYPEPIRTSLWLTPPGGGSQVTTYYFRTHFTVTQDLSGFTLTASAFVDDGAVFYLNGAEVGRLRMNVNPVLFDTFATQNQQAEGSLETVIFPAGNLLNGDNVLAVEVHQDDANSSDVMFGLSLTANRTITNFTGLEVVINEVMANNTAIPASDGSVTDWIELYNAGEEVMDLAGMSLSDDLTQPQRWIFPAGVTLAPGAYLVVRCDSAAAASTNNGPVLNTGFGLSANGDAIWLFDVPARGGTLLDGVTFGLQAANFSIGRFPNGSGSWSLTLATPDALNLSTSLGPVSNLRINEWMANDRGDADDWFELYNPNPQPVAIGGLYLTDKLDNPAKHRIAGLSFIGSHTNGYAKFIADNHIAQGANHVGFRLSAEGEALALYPPSSAQAIDVVVFGPQAAGISQGRFPDGSSNIIFFPYSVSPKESNYLPLDHVVINEALTHSDPPFEDAIELRNLSDDPVSIAGWFLSDSLRDLRKFRIPDGTILPPQGYVVFYEQQFNPEPGSYWSFSLDSTDGDEIYLSTGDDAFNFTGYRTSVKFGAAANGVSFGRYETSVGADFTAMTARSLGADDPLTVEQFRTGAGLPNPEPIIGPVVISEIQYHPPDVGTNDNVADEFIELHNLTGEAVPLFDVDYPTNTWGLKDAVAYHFPVNTTLEAGGYLLVVSFDPTNTPVLDAFTQRYQVPPSVPVLGPYSGKLDNSSDSVELYRPDTPQLPPAPDAGFVPRVLVDKVKYGDTVPWPELADGHTNGYSLQRIDVAAYGNDPVNWTAGVPTAGAANGAAVVAPPVILIEPEDQNVFEGSNVTFSVSALGAAPLSFQWRFNGFPIPDATNSTLILPNARPADIGRYRVLVSNPGGSASSRTATLFIMSPPTIVQQPQPAAVPVGSPVTFNVVARGSSPLHYQWLKNGAELAGENQFSLTFANAQVADDGNYAVVITNQFGAVTSQVASLTVSLPPVITAQPQSLNAQQGSLVSFAVEVGGTPPFGYQWFFNGAPIPGAVDPVLNLLNVQTNHSGEYSVAIGNLAGSVTSAVARLWVIPVPIVTVEASVPEIGEGSAAAGQFTISRSFVTNAPLEVSFALGGTAVSGVDYGLVTSPVSIPADTAAISVPVAAIDDVDPEAIETVALTLLGGVGYAVGNPQNAVIRIRDNDNQAPAAAIIFPEELDSFTVSPTNLTLMATASDPEGLVARVEFFQGGTNKIGEAMAAPFNIVWTNAPGGNHTLTAVVTDGFGLAATSAPVHISINVAPNLIFNGPGNGTVFEAPAAITFNAFAFDSDGVLKVEFYAEDNLIGTITNAPYRLTWPDVGVGDYELTAKAYDRLGAVSVSQATVHVILPVIELTDLFALRSIVDGSPITVEGSNEGADDEGGEPNPFGRRNNRDTMWLGWRATYSSQVTINTFGSSFNTLLAVYTGNAVNSLALVVSNDDANGPQSQVTFPTQAGTVYNIQVSGRRSFGQSGNGDIRLNIQELEPAPYITRQPASQTVSRGASATFTVGVTGDAPLSFQWRFNGVDIPGATVADLVLNNVQVLENQGAYSVRISNAFGSAVSEEAILTVDDGLFHTETIQLIAQDQVWRYDQSGLDRLTEWRDTAYDDSTWATGPALLGFEDSPGVEYPTILTPLTPPELGGPNTIYFRTHFSVSTLGAAVTLRSSNWVDDGAVWYLNGQEVARLRMPDGTVNYFTQASSPFTEGQVSVLELPSDALQPGDNVMAVEVHQSSSTSSDVIFGMTLEAEVTIASQPAIEATEIMPNGDFQLQLDGIAGRVYAIDYSTDLKTWTPLTTFTNLTGQTLIIDPAAMNNGPRYYRGRLVP